MDKCLLDISSTSGVWFTADLHLGHRNIIKYCNRPFVDEVQMDNAIIDSWNSVVAPGETVFVVGDFTLRDIHSALAYLERLSGKIVVLPGSHDKWIFNPASVEQVYFWLGKALIWPQAAMIRVAGETIFLHHYAQRVWPHSHHGSYHLYGHSHGRLKDNGTRSIDVGVDACGFRPISASQVFDKLSSRKYGPTLEIDL